MAIDLGGPRAKIERTDEHLNALYSELQAFFDPYFNRRFAYHTRDGSWDIILVRPLLYQPPPLRFSIICGDGVHKLLTALDNLIWQVVLAERNKPGKWNPFPIYSDPKDFNRDVRFHKNNRGPGPLEGTDTNEQA